MFKYLQFLTLIILITISVTACRKKSPINPPLATAPAAKESTPEPAPAKPEISSFVVSPQTIAPGQSARISWRVNDGANIEISPGIGMVSAVGDTEVSPTETTVYTLKATGPGGEVIQSATLTVAQPSQPRVEARGATVSLSERLARDVSDIYFGYDRHTLDTSAMSALRKNAEALRGILEDFPNAEIIMQGHCDERGTAEYNLGLGDRRADIAKQYLEQLGLDVSRLRIISLGNERPQCTEATEDCWRINRRVHFTTGN